MRWLKILLAINGIVLLVYAATNTLAPTSYFLPSDAPGYAVDVTRVVGVGYLAFGLVQLGMWLVTDQMAIRIVAGTSLVYAAGFALLAFTSSASSSVTFHEIGVAAGIGNGLVAVLYAILLYREARTAA